jgi:hypothetical protein
MQNPIPQGLPVSPITELEEYYDAEVMNMVKSKVTTHSDSEVSNSTREEAN